MSEVDEEEERLEEGEEGENAVPELWRYVAEDKVGQIVKYLNTKEEEEFPESLQEANPANGQSLMMWATLRERFVLVEWLIKRGKREAFAFRNKTHLAIYDKWVEERKAKADRDKEAAEEAAAKAAEGIVPEEEEDKPAEPEMFQTVLEGMEGEEGVDVYAVRTIGELGLYEGGRDAAGNKTGLGQTLFPNGDMYIGEYKNNKREGVGTYFWAKEGNIYVGKWHNDMRSGLGRMVYVDGGRFYGAWLNDRKNGKGRYTYPNGDTYNGDWENDLREGSGIYTFAADSSSYVGTFRKGDFTSGKWVLSGGVVYYGVFKNFKPTGRGVFVFNGKFKQEGEYRKGQWVIHRVRNLKSEEDIDFQLSLQGRDIALRYTPEQAGKLTMEQLVSIANCSSFEEWKRAIEAQKKISVTDVRVRSVDIDPTTNELLSIRMAVDAYEPGRTDGLSATTKLPLSNVVLQPIDTVVVPILVTSDGAQHVIGIRKPNLSVPDYNALSLPAARKDIVGLFRGAEIAAVSEVFGLEFGKQSMTNLTELCFSNGAHSLLTSSADNTSGFITWLYKQHIHNDYFTSLPAKIEAYNQKGLGFQLALLDFNTFLQSVTDTRTACVMLLLEALGDRIPTQTLAPQRPPTPLPPAPEPAPQYTEEELAAQKAAFEAEAAKRKQREQEAAEKGEGEEEEE